MVPLILAFVAYRGYICRNHAIEPLRSQMFIGKMLSSIVSVRSRHERTVIFAKGAVQLRNDLVLKIIR
jgi:hypothetical protein